MAINGHRNAVQLPRNVKIASADRAGVTSGIATCHQTWNSLRPSSRAASSSSSGTLSKNCFIRNVPNPVISPGKAMPQ